MFCLSGHKYWIDVVMIKSWLNGGGKWSPLHYITGMKKRREKVYLIALRTNIAIYLI